MLHGESAPRLAFLRHLLEAGPAAGLDPIDGVLGMGAVVGQAHAYYLAYFGVHQPAQMRFILPEGEEYRAEIVDTWAMTVTPVAEPVVSGVPLRLPARPYHAVVLQRI